MITKKLILAVLALTLMAALLCGCGATEPVAEVPTEAPVQEMIVAEDPTEAPTEAPAPKTLTVPESVVMKKEGECVTLYEGDIDMQEITWSSADETVATVAAGVVTAVQRGQTTITATYEDQVVTCAVDCDLPVPMVLDVNAGERDPMYLPPDVEIVDDSFFDDALFIGDSQGVAFYNCVKYAGYIDGAVHMCRNSYSIDSAEGNKMLLSWRGNGYVIEEAIAQSGANRVFIMLGINDVGYYKVDTVGQLMEKWAKVIDRIKTRTPHVEICIQSLLPVWTGGETDRVNNEIVRAYNEHLEVLAEEKGCVYIDLASYFVDSTGGLADPYTNDKYVHTNAAGVDTWVKVLKACTTYGE